MKCQTIQQKNMYMILKELLIDEQKNFNV